MANHLYYGDNLTVLRDAIASESVDLVYLDPPFNSNADYNALFKTPNGQSSPAQMEAFTDTCTWDDATSGVAVEEVKLACAAVAEEQANCPRSPRRH